MLSAIEKIICLKQVPFFEGMTVEHLKILANVCEEELFEEDTSIYTEGEPGGALYVVVRGRVAIEGESGRQGSTARIATIEAHSYFGEGDCHPGYAHPAAEARTADYPCSPVP
jgi:CRP-like cAMP-binding protein